MGAVKQENFDDIVAASRPNIPDVKKIPLLHADASTAEFL